MLWPFDDGGPDASHLGLPPNRFVFLLLGSSQYDTSTLGMSNLLSRPQQDDNRRSGEQSRKSE